jgi:hypothetical protein
MRTQGEVMKQLEASNPVVSSTLEDWPASERGVAILTRVMSQPAEALAVRPFRRLFPRLAFTAAAVIAAVVAGVVLGSLTGDRRGASAAAADVLYAAARVAERKPPTTIPTEGYRYTKSEDASRVFYDACSVPSKGSGETPTQCPRPPPDDWAFSVLVPHTREIWVAPDGSGRLVVATGEPKFFGPRDKATWEAAGSPRLDRTGTSDESFGPGGLSYADLSKYSTDPDELYEQIRQKAEGYGPSTDAEMFVLVGDLLRETLAPPRLRAALFRVAARIPSVELVGEVIDPAGRKGIAVARTSDDVGFLERSELIFDPETSELLAERQVLLERVKWADAEPGTVIGYAVYLESAVVDSTSDRPSP